MDCALGGLLCELFNGLIHGHELRALDDPLAGGREQWEMKDSYESPLALMLDVMNNALAPKTLRYQAAKDALPYCHPRKEGGKKEEREKEAKKAATGKFRPGKRPGQSQRMVN